MSIRVLVADDHRLILDAVRRALEDVDDVEIVGEAHSGSQVVPLVGRTHPDLVLLDLQMPEMDGLACLDLIRQRYPAVKVVILSASGSREQITSAFRRGATAYIVKTVNPVDLASALRQAAEASVYQGVGLLMGSGSDSSRAAELGLTERELDVLGALARGLSNRAISRELWITEQTVKFHLRNIYRKLDVSNRTEAARAALERGVVEKSS